MCEFPDIPKIILPVIPSMGLPSLSIQLPKVPPVPEIPDIGIGLDLRARLSLAEIAEIEASFSVEMPDAPKISLPVIPSMGLPSLSIQLPDLPDAPELDVSLSVGGVQVDLPDVPKASLPSIPPIGLPSFGVKIPKIPSPPSCPFREGEE